MRWIAVGLASVSLLGTMLAIGAGFLGILPARGSEPIFTFAGICLDVALATALVATILAVLDYRRLRARHPNRPGGGSAVAFILSGSALLASGGIFAVMGMLAFSNQQTQAKSAAAKVRHAKPLTPAERASAKPITAEALVKEWTHDHDACDRLHRDEVFELTWTVGGLSYVDESNCAFLLSHGDVICCLASGEPNPAPTTHTLFARYGGTDRRYSTPGQDQGTLVFDGCALR